MKLVVIMDDDGHFQVSHLSNRVETINLITLTYDSYDGLDYFLEVTDFVEEDLLTISDEKFNNFVETTEQRGRLEIIDLV